MFECVVREQFYCYFVLLLCLCVLFSLNVLVRLVCDVLCDVVCVVCVVVCVVRLLFMLFVCFVCG